MLSELDLVHELRDDRDNLLELCMIGWGKKKDYIKTKFKKM